MIHSTPLPPAVAAQGGTEGPERLTGSDRVYDSLYGNGGADVLAGLSGNDTLVGGLGRDLLIGGEGRDRFVFDAPDQPDIVKDFEAGVDVFDVSDWGVTWRQIKAGLDYHHNVTVVHGDDPGECFIVRGAFGFSRGDFEF